MKISAHKVNSIKALIKLLSDKDLNELSEAIKKELMERKIRVINGER